MAQRSSDDRSNVGPLIPTIRVTAHRLPRSRSVPHSGAAGSDEAIADEATLVRGTQRLTISGSMAHNGSALPAIRAAATRVEDGVPQEIEVERPRIAPAIQPERSLPSVTVRAIRSGTASRDHDTGR